MDAATINARLPEALKRHGSEVLKCNGISTSAAIRSLYEHLEQTQAVPEWMQDSKADVYARRRELAKSLASRQDSVPADYDAKEAYRAHLLDKYGGPV